jgi:hypothetical protein
MPSFNRLFRLMDGKQPTQIVYAHLRSQYLALKAKIPNTDETAFIEGLGPNGDSATWNDLYYFELILSNYLPPEKLRSKIMRLRSDYRNVAGQKKFDDYMAAKPPDLQSPPDPTDPPHASHEHYEKLLREDLKDLLGRMYFEYSILPVREERLSDLTWFAARLCLISLILLMAIIGILFLIPLITEMHETTGDWVNMLGALRASDKLSALTVFVVAVVGAMGGFVSALQRIQSPPTEGDSLYNLSLLFYGSSSVFVAPISGAIFAILLYLLFSAGILSGSFFPTIFTPQGNYATQVTPDEAPNANVSNSALDSPPTGNTTSSGNSSQAGGELTTRNTNTTRGPKQTPSPTPKPVPKSGLNVFDFLADSGPPSGRDYALLIIWCFIAGFAERFVPDALDRLVAKGNQQKSD